MLIETIKASDLLLQGNVIAAEQAIRIILSNNPKDEDSLSTLGHCLMAQNKYKDAIEIFSKIIFYFPTSANGFIELGSAYLASNEHVSAELAFKKATELNPKLSLAWHFLGNLLMKRGAREKAKICFIQTEKLDPFRSHFIEVNSAFKQKKFKKVEKICKKILNQNTNHPQAIYVLALLAEQNEAYEEAIKLLYRGLKYSPFHFSLWLSLVGNFAKVGLQAKAIHAAEELIAIDPQEFKYYMLLAGELANAGFNEKSLIIYNKAAALSPNDANLHLQRGHILKSMGKRAECELAYRQSLALEEINGAAFWALADLKSHRFNQSDKNQMLSLFENKNISKVQSTQAGFALAKYYEDNNQFDKAFNYYQQANQAKPDVCYNPDEYQQTCEIIQRSFSSKTLSIQAGAKLNGPTPIFIVGLTRSGSTLIEQILASHSHIEGTMELYCLPRTVRRATNLCKTKGYSYPQDIEKLSTEELATLGQSYLDETTIYRSNKAYFIDKMPPNFHNVGLIHKILPHAIIIDARRHPLSAGFSNFKQHFSRGYDFSYNLKHIGHYYNNYLKLMDYWDKVLPNKVFCVQYEDMVQNTENQIGKILSHCNLSFEQQCLKFYENKRPVRTASSEQVRQPINNKGIQQWKNFEAHLTPLKLALGETTLQRFSLWQ